MHPFIVLAGFALLAGPAMAERRQHGNIVYDLPPGWSVGALRDGAQTLISDLPNDVCEFCYIHFTEGRTGDETLPMFLTSQRLRFVDTEDRDDVVILQNPKMIEAEGRRIGLMGLKVHGELQIHYAAKIDGRLELMVFTGPADDEAEVAETMETFQTRVSPLFDRAAFVSEGAESPMPAPRPGDLNGLWWGFTTSWTMGLDMMMTMQLDHRHLVFWPDGHFYDGTPPDGLKPLDPASLLARGDMEFGTYRVAGRRLTLTFATGETEVFARDGSDWVADDLTIMQVKTLPDGATIAGTLSSTYFSGFSPGAGVTGGVSSSAFTTFSRDGTYGGERFGGAFGSFDNGGYAVGSETPESGRYAISDGVLIRTPVDRGTPERDLVFRMDGDIMVGAQTLEE